MLIKIIPKKEIVSKVQRAVTGVKKELFMTMLLKEEAVDPLPKTYHELLKNKLKDGIKIKRLGFGSKKEYVLINKRLTILSRNYNFRYLTKINRYQRLIIIDKNQLFFCLKHFYFYSSYKPLINLFLQYFMYLFKKTKK